MQDEPVVRFKDVTKSYRLGHERSNVRAALPGSWGEPRGRDSFRALDRVSFNVYPGESVGIVGPNGAGKSTILKILSGSVAPTHGEIERPRDFVSIIELGLGFDPDLTGIENLQAGGALMGMNSVEISEKQQAIIDFAELADFADMPVKRYSTGMLARLGFALATAVDADLYVVDEVLSVGDWGFQRKSLERMRNLKEQGATVIFVSHNLWVVNQLCDRAILIENGAIVAEGPTANVLGVYLGSTPYLNDLNEPDTSSSLTVPSGESIQLGAETSAIDPGQLAGSPDVEITGLPDEVSISLDAADWRPVIIHELECQPAEIYPADPMDLVGVIEVKRAVPGLRLIVGAYWEGFAGFAVPDQLPSDFLQDPGWYRFRIHYKSVTCAPAPATFQVAVVTKDEPDDPEQLLPNALEKRRADMRVLGELTSRPGAYLARTWEHERIEAPVDDVA